MEKAHEFGFKSEAPGDGAMTLTGFSRSLAEQDDKTQVPKDGSTSPAAADTSERTLP